MELKQIIRWANDLTSYEDAMKWADIAFVKIWTLMERTSFIPDEMIEGFVERGEMLSGKVDDMRPIIGTLDDSSDSDLEDAIIAYITFVTETWEDLTGEVLS